MKTRRQANRLCIVRNSGVLAIFGLPLALIGITLMYCVTIALRQTGLEYPLIFWSGLLLGLLILITGLSISLGRKGVVIDVNQGKITFWWGWLIPFRKQAFDLHRYTGVTLTEEMHHAGNDRQTSSTVYPIRFSSHQDLFGPLLIDAPKDLIEARTLAEEMACLIDKPLMNSSLGRVMTYQPRELRRSLAERLGVQSSVQRVVEEL